MKKFMCTKYYRKLFCVLIIFALVTTKVKADMYDDYDASNACDIPACAFGTHPSGCICIGNDHLCAYINFADMICRKCIEGNYIE